MDENIRTFFYNTVVIGTGAAGLNAADRLYQYGQKDIAIVTEGMNTGTSRNTGSDKQTYYKLTLSGADQDSVREMAQTLFEGQCVDGDTALCEAALSVQGFLRLVELGVRFPRNRYGEYIGYKTDHDPRRRASSAGPYTSKLMTEALEQSVRSKNITIYDELQVIRILSDRRKVCGLLCLDKTAQEDPKKRFVAFCCRNVILATGGPAGMYADSVYPKGHYGAAGLAFRAGARGQNLTEWQYGLASVSPRWNVSGTYMQAMPRFISARADGSDPREFLYDFFTNEGDMLTQVFLKGYQWPFDVRKAAKGSSVIDILVYLESQKGRKVFLDFRTNPGGKEIDFSAVSEEARAYLQKAGACFGTPLERLAKMNLPAVEFYREKGVDLSRGMLEIALCAQHNNGGIAVDDWWQTRVKGLFVCGEAAGSHGVYRPGGSALNAGQAGSARAAQYIAARCLGEADRGLFEELLKQGLREAEDICKAVLSDSRDTLKEKWTQATRLMSAVGGAVRNQEKIEKALETLTADRKSFTEKLWISNPARLCQVFHLEDILLCQQIYLSAMADYIKKGGNSRGSALYTNPAGERPFEGLLEEMAFLLEDGSLSGLVQEAEYQDCQVRFFWRRVRPIPEEEDFFENVWRSYRENGNIF